MSTKEQLVELMERKGLTQTQVSRAIGKSTALVSQFLQEKYTGDIGACQGSCRLC